MIVLRNMKVSMLDLAELRFTLLLSHQSTAYVAASCSWLLFGAIVEFSNVQSVMVA